MIDKAGILDSGLFRATVGPEVLPIRRGETPRRGSGILQPVQQLERHSDQSGVRLRFDSDTRI